VSQPLLTHIGGPTVLIQVGGWRLLTDPTFDPPGQKYSFGWGTGSVKLAGPAVAAGELGRIDAVLLTHDHHDDNLDPAGRALLPSADAIVTCSGSPATPCFTTVCARSPTRLQVDVALLHLGGVQFPVTGPVRYTLTAKDAVDLCRLIGPRTAVPIQYEGWRHFKQGREAIEREFARAPEDIRRRVRWLPLGVEVEIAG